MAVTCFSRARWTGLDARDVPAASGSKCHLNSAEQNIHKFTAMPPASVIVRAARAPARRHAPRARRRVVTRSLLIFTH